MSDGRPIGIFDSGIGGLSVWREIVRQLPHESTLYFADQIHVPYGPRTQEQIRQFCDTITRFLMDRGCKAVVVACNTASAAALKYLRETFPQLPSVGMEPAVKPAAQSTRTGVVGVMATPATFQGKLFQATVGRHANGIQLINQICTGLAEQVEAGKLDGAETGQMLRGFIEPMLAANADTIVLACTHYPFVLDAIRHVAGAQVNVIDPSPAIARQVGRVLADAGLTATGPSMARHEFYTSGDPQACRVALKQLVNVDQTVKKVLWHDDRTLTE